MEKSKMHTRRAVIKSSLLGVVAVSVPNIIYAKEFINKEGRALKYEGDLSDRYPSIDDEIALEMVSVSHFDLKRVTELVTNRPELARASWDWAFGDWETAIGAASHTGRRDIAKVLMEHGARPTIFTLAMLGEYQALKSIIKSRPGIESITGPHGISLLEHAKAGLRSDGLSKSEISNSKRLVDYLQKLGSADPKTVNLPLTADQKAIYAGDYKYGDEPNAGFTVKLNKSNILKLGRLGESGGLLYYTGNHAFTYRGVTSVKFKFSVQGGVVQYLTVEEPNLILKAVKV